MMMNNFEPCSVKLDLTSALKARAQGNGQLSKGVRKCLTEAHTYTLSELTVYKGPCVYYSITLTEENIKKALRIGDGNLHLGIRSAIHQYIGAKQSL